MCCWWGALQNLTTEFPVQYSGLIFQNIKKIKHIARCGQWPVTLDAVLRGRASPGDALLCLALILQLLDLETPLEFGEELPMESKQGVVWGLRIVGIYQPVFNHQCFHNGSGWISCCHLNISPIKISEHKVLCSLLLKSQLNGPKTISERYKSDGI